VTGHRIVHLGVGNFHRAHQAWYTQIANEASGEDWRIVGVSLRRPDMRDALAPQGFNYTLEIDDGRGPEYQTITVIDDILVAPEDGRAVLEAIADPRTAIVTLTVTEKGYYLRPSDRSLDTDHPAIRFDFDAERPTTTIGILAAGLSLRLQRRMSPLTVLCCDNLPDNGPVLRRAVEGFAQRRDPVLAMALDSAASFPGTMVDRIVPATTDEVRRRVEAATGRPDAWPVATERFSQWVIEDRFAGPRPAWERAVAEFVAEVRPYELRKLRMLNGAHSTLAYAGVLAGKTFVHDAIADPELLRLARGVMTEAAATLPDDVRASAQDYADALTERFGNAGLQHRLRQIAMDGSQKIPVRLLAPLRERLAKTMPSPTLEAAIAAWLAFVLHETAAGTPLDDPCAADLASICRSADDRNVALRALLDYEPVFGSLRSEFPEACVRIEQKAQLSARSGVSQSG
jgi:fructuronate reductase